MEDNTNTLYTRIYLLLYTRIVVLHSIWATIIKISIWISHQMLLHSLSLTILKRDFGRLYFCLVLWSLRLYILRVVFPFSILLMFKQTKKLKSVSYAQENIPCLWQVLRECDFPAWPLWTLVVGKSILSSDRWIMFYNKNKK